MKSRPSKLDPFAARLTEWFGIEKISLKEAQERLKQDGCTISATSLSEWWSRRQEQMLRDQLLTRIATGSELNRQITAEYQKHPAPELETLIKLFKTLILQLSMSGVTNPGFLEMVPALMRQVLEAQKIGLKTQEISLDERRVALLEKKAAQADSAKKVVESALTPEQKQLQLKQIFGMS